MSEGLTADIIDRTINKQLKSQVASILKVLSFLRMVVHRRRYLKMKKEI